MDQISCQVSLFLRLRGQAEAGAESPHVLGSGMVLVGVLTLSGQKMHLSWVPSTPLNQFAEKFPGTQVRLENMRR